MDPRKTLIDERLRTQGTCVYCGGLADSREHIPSKILLDDPFPSNLPVVDACISCNVGFSLDEEYLACFVECVLVGSTRPDLVSRAKIARAIEKRPELACRIESSCQRTEEGTLIWVPERDRVHNVVVKLARGHAAYELGASQLGNPDEVIFVPLISMSDEDRNAFDNASAGEIRGWPELGSPAFLRAVGACDDLRQFAAFPDQTGPWIVVQPNRYRYAVDQYGGVRVQIVISEYLACAVGWEDS